MWLNSLKSFIMREWFLIWLIVLYIVLVIKDYSLIYNTPYLIDWKSLALITSLIIISKGLEFSGIFTSISLKLITLSKGSEKKLFIILIFIIALSSAIIMNDTAMLIFIPIVVITSKLAGINTAKAVTISAIAANVGSSLTPIGNPQNIIIWDTYKVPFFNFILNMLPYVLIWFFILILFTFSIKGRKYISFKNFPSVKINKKLLVASSFLLITSIIFAETNNAILSLPFTLIIFLILEKKVLINFDWALILTFAFIFIDFNELSHILLSECFIYHPEKLTSYIISAVLSQIISNVPATVLLLSSKNWIYLALGVNIGGTGTLISSLANLIAIRISKISIKEFHKISIPYFLINFIITMIILIWV